MAIGPIITDGGFFLFPLAYILGDVISEVYGFKVARNAIIITFALSMFASLCYWVIIALPGFDDEFGTSKQAALEGALGPVPQIVLASLLASCCSYEEGSACVPSDPGCRSSSATILASRRRSRSIAPRTRSSSLRMTPA